VAGWVRPVGALHWRTHVRLRARGANRSRSGPMDL